MERDGSRFLMDMLIFIVKLLIVVKLGVCTNKSPATPLPILLQIHRDFGRKVTITYQASLLFLFFFSSFG